MTTSRNLEQFSAQEAFELFRSTQTALQQGGRSESEIAEFQSVKAAAVERMKAACAGSPKDLAYYQALVHNMDYLAWPKA